eukprot:7011434-Pyramimonas_sp.AAC.1
MVMLDVILHGVNIFSILKLFVTVLAGLSIQYYWDGVNPLCVPPSVWGGGAYASGPLIFSWSTGLASDRYNSPRSNRAG